MSNRDFEIGQTKFKLNKIDAFKQFHIARRLAPILADLLPAMKTIQKVEKAGLSESEKLDQFAEIATPLLKGLSNLSDEDSNKVLFGLLSSVEVQQEATGNWAKVSNDQMLLIQNLELPILLQIAGRAFAFNLQGFFGALPRQS